MFGNYCSSSVVWAGSISIATLSASAINSIGSILVKVHRPTNAYSKGYINKLYMNCNCIKDSIVIGWPTQ